MNTILVIDDEPRIVDNLTDLLEAEGYRVLQAANGQDGLEVARLHDPDLILCDILMPRLDGYGVLKSLREDTRTAAIPFIFLTSRSEADDFRVGMNLGADDYLTKPFRLNEILQAVGSRLRKHKTLDEVHELRIQNLRQGLSQVIPHELRTPLGAVLGVTQVLKTDWQDMDPDLVNSMLDDLLVEGKRLQRLVENYSLYIQFELLDSGMVDAASFLNPVPSTPVAEVIKEQALLVAGRYDRLQDLKLDLVHGGTGVSEFCVGKIVEELVDNALKFSEPGTPVRVSSRREDRFYVLQVVDEGRGMTTRQVRRLGSFVQIDREHHEQQGLGLGLSIAKKMLHRFGGDLKIRSEAGKGTEVIGFIPVSGGPGSIE